MLVACHAGLRCSAVWGGVSELGAVVSELWGCEAAECGDLPGLLPHPHYLRSL